MSNKDKVTFHSVTAIRKQKNRKYHQQNLEWLSDLLQSKYWTQSNISFSVIDGGSGKEAVSNQNIDFEDVENDSFENMFEITNKNQICTRKWALMRTWYKTSAQLKPSKLQKVTYYA